MPPSHLPLHHLKKLSGMLVFIESVQPNYPHSESSFDKQQVDNARLTRGSIEAVGNSVRARILLHADSGGSNGRLDHFIAEVVDHAESQIRSDIGTSSPAVADAISSALRKRAKRISCKKCSPQKICSGISEDYIAIERKGLCIKSLKNIFEFSRETAVKYYQRYSSLFDPAMVPTTTFSTCRATEGEKPHRLPIDVYVNGANRFDAIDRSRTSVLLEICLELFDAASYLTIPYIMFHECLAHAFHAITPRPERKIVVEPHYSFEEGYMAYVAWVIMQEVLDGESRIMSLDKRIPFPSDSVFHGNNFHQARINWQHRNASNAASSLYRGEEAAKRLYLNICNLCSTDQKAKEIWLKLSLDLNMLSDFDQVRKTQMLVTIFDKLPRHGVHHAGEEELKKSGPCHSILRKYIKSENVRDFLDEMLSL